MELASFRNRLLEAAAAARAFAHQLVIEELPSDLVFRINLNASHDANASPEFILFPEDSLPTRRFQAHASADDATQAIWTGSPELAHRRHDHAGMAVVVLLLVFAVLAGCSHQEASVWPPLVSPSAPGPRAALPPAQPVTCPDPRPALSARARDSLPGGEHEEEIVELGDLNGDGYVEVGANVYSRAINLSWISARTTDHCYEDVMTDALGEVGAPLPGTSNGWHDLALRMTLNGLGGNNNACSVGVRARFDGKKYVPIEIMSVNPVLTGGDTDLVACRKQAEDILRER